MATGDSLCTFPPLTLEMPASNYPQVGIRNGHPTIDFDAATKETCYFTGVLPRNYGGGGLTVRIIWVAVAITNNVVWLAAIERMDGATDLDADSFAADQTVTTACPGTSGAPATSDIPFTSGAQMDSLTLGEPFRLRIARDAANAADTAANDAQIIAIEIRET